MIKNNIYKICSILLSYPSLELKEHIETLHDVIKKDNLLSFNDKELFKDLIEFIKKNNLLDIQEYYVSTFDRNKELSLYLFEHIHGDSRERGMAMIDLMNLYKNSNFIIDKKNELPDYIPLFLEYLSLMPPEKSEKLLAEIINIIAILSRRLKNINNTYYVIFTILENISPIKCDDKIINEIIIQKKSVKNNNTDQDWEEPKIF